MLAGVLDALEALPAEAAGVRGRVRVLHLVLPVRGTRAEPANKGELIAFTLSLQCRGQGHIILCYGHLQYVCEVRGHADVPKLSDKKTSIAFSQTH